MAADNAEIVRLTSWASFLKDMQHIGTYKTGYEHTTTAGATTDSIIMVTIVTVIILIDELDINLQVGRGRPLHGGRDEPLRACN